MEETNISEIPALDLGRLGEQLYKFLLSDAIAANPLQVNCFFSEETLIVVIQYSQTLKLQKAATFSCVREFLDRQGSSALYPTEIYLTSEEPSSFLKNGTVDHEAENMMSIPRQKKRPSLPKPPQAKQLALFQENNLHFPILSPPILSDYFRRKKLLGLGLGLGILAITLYGLSDPCITGTCPSLSQAKFLINSSLLVLEPDSSSSLLATKQKLSEARVQLQSIPWWSPYRSQANALDSEAQTILKDIDLLNPAIASGNQATLLMQKSSLSIPEWQTVQSLLTKSIKQLKQLPTNSQFQAFAIAQSQQYEKALLASNQRLQQEQLANTIYEEAMKIGRVAKVQENMAQSIDDFDKISATWKKAIQFLENISQGTTPYDKTSKFLDLYGQAYKAIDARKKNEALAEINLQKAIQEAQIAEKSEQSQQWSLAVSHWKNALVYLKEIPDNSFQSTKAKSLSIQYNLSLNKAQANFKNANRLQFIKNNLAKICSQENKACNYSIDKNMIKVKLTSSYLQQIWDLSIQAKLNANIKEQADILNHLARLEQSFQMISNQAKIPLAVYNSKGNLMTTYRPISQN
ncbi:MAG: hypothetical protein VKL41_18840 [Snowella sp.]|nr:hypothetical protein [Snowella sp.]